MWVVFLCPFLFTEDPQEGQPLGGFLCLYMLYTSVHGFRSTCRTKAQRSKWISASFHCMSSSTKANIASIFHTSLSNFFFLLYQVCLILSHVHSRTYHINTRTNITQRHMHKCSILDKYAVVYIFMCTLGPENKHQNIIVIPMWANSTLQQ